jgi:hypothetical protein
MSADKSSFDGIAVPINQSAPRSMKPTRIASNPRSFSNTPDPRAGISPLFVKSMICLTAVLTLGMVSLVFFRSQSITEPTCAAVVTGDPSLDGATVAVFSYDRQIASATLSRENGYATPVLLQPGVYELQVTIREQLLLADKFAVQSLRYASFSLPTAVVVEGDSSMAGAVVEMSGPERPSPITLGPENSYTALSYHFPGKYHLTVTRNGRIIRDELLHVAAHRPLRILLGYPLDPAVFSHQED